MQYKVISANYEFDHEKVDSTSIYKLHGTIEKDRADGSLSKLTLSNQDYVDATSYREDLYDRLLMAGASNNLLIVGHSLADPDLNVLIDEATRRRVNSGSIGRVYVLAYQRDDDRALLLEQRGFRVAFGGLDEFTSTLSSVQEANVAVSIVGTGLLAKITGLAGLTTDVAHALELQNSDAVRMFYGSPASYADIEAGLAFSRDVVPLVTNLLDADGVPFVLISGVAGVGKTTAARQALVNYSKAGTPTFEHMSDRPLSANKWLALHEQAVGEARRVILFVDEAHKHVFELGAILEVTGGAPSNVGLKILACTSRAQWAMRTKQEALHLFGREIPISRLSPNEIERLLDLFQSRSSISKLVEKEFAGFSRGEKRRRLTERCQSDFFVCLRNVMSTDLLDDIILREYNDLSLDVQAVYKTLSGLEAAGVRVHRQSMLRLQSIAADKVSSLLSDMDGMISESVLDDDHGIFTWSGRHPVISAIISDAKYSDDSELFELFEKFIAQANPSYFIERVNLQELCHANGIRKLSSREVQNVLYRQIISKAPKLHPPRHRLISNLIADGVFERAGDEIRIFESDLGADGPLVRYKALLKLRRAEHVKGLGVDDRKRLIEQASDILVDGIDRYPYDKLLLDTYCTVGLQYVKLFGDWKIIDEALNIFNFKAENSPDPEIKRLNNQWVLKVQDIKSGR